MPESPLIVDECEFPSASVLHPDYVDKAYFHDSYRTLLTRPDSNVVAIFFAIFGHRPMWMKLVMVARNWLASLVGIQSPSSAEIMNPELKSSYAVGDKIGAWPIFVLNHHELVAGRDNKHLDFRLSILRETGGSDGETASAVVSTVCTVHNRFGKVYLFFIVPFHKWGVRWLIRSAGLAGRL